MKKLLFIICTAAIFTSCKKSDVKFTSVFGTWEKVQQSGTIAGTTKTFNKGEGNLLQLNSDSTFNMLAKFQSELHGKFNIIKNGVNWAGATYDAIYFYGQYPPNVNYVILPNFITLKGDTLTIGNTYPDGVISKYVRQK